MSQQPVLIIGAGLGGLTLACALQKFGIPYQICERDSAGYRIAQGYRITLDNTGASGLATALSEEQFAEFEATCGEHHLTAGHLDGPSGRLIRGGPLGIFSAGGMDMIISMARRFLGRRLFNWKWYKSWVLSDAPEGPSIPKVPFKRWPTDRRTLRTLLLRTHTDRVTFNRTFVSYTTTEDGVTALFTDGSSATGCLLVGADGTRSRVVAQLLGDAYRPPLDLGVRVIYGKTPLTPLVEEKLHPSCQRGVAFVTDRRPSQPPRTLVLEAMRFHYVDSPKDYVFWALAVRTRDLGEGNAAKTAESLSGEEAAALSRHFTSDWDPLIQVLMKEQRTSESAVLRLTSSRPEGVPVWETNRRVTVLGDAVHSMPPTGGQGANTAMHDAALLAIALRDAPTLATSGWARPVIQSYEDAMRWNMGDIVGLACIGASRLFAAELDVAVKTA